MFILKMAVIGFVDISHMAIFCTFWASWCEDQIAFYFILFYLFFINITTIIIKYCLLFRIYNSQYSHFDYNSNNE